MEFKTEKQFLTLEETKELLPRCEVHWFDVSLHHRYYVLLQSVHSNPKLYYVYPSEEMFALLEKRKVPVQTEKPTPFFKDCFLQIRPSLVHISRHISKDDPLLLFAEETQVRVIKQSVFIQHFLNLLKPTFEQKSSCLTSKTFKTHTALPQAQTIVQTSIRQSASNKLLLLQDQDSDYRKSLAKQQTWQELLIFASQYCCQHEHGLQEFQWLAQATLKHVGDAKLFQLALNLFNSTQFSLKQQSLSSVTVVMIKICKLWFAVMDRLLVARSIFDGEPNVHFLQGFQFHFT